MKVLGTSILIASLTFTGPYAGAGKADYRDFVFKVQKEALARFAIGASHRKDMAELIKQSRYPEVQKYFASHKFNSAKPKIFVSHDGITVEADGRRVAIEATNKPFTFKLNGKEFKFDPALSYDQLASRLQMFLFPKRNNALIEFFLPSADAIIGEVLTVVAVAALVGIELGAAIFGPIVGCAVGINDHKPGVNSAKGCWDGAALYWETLAVMPLIFFPDLQGVVADITEWEAKMVGKSNFKCDEDGGFTVTSGWFNKSPKYSFESKHRELVFSTEFDDEIRVKLSEVGKFLKESPVAEKFDDPDELESMAQVIGKDVRRMEEACLQDPDTVYRWSRTKFEKATEPATEPAVDAGFPPITF